VRHKYTNEGQTAALRMRLKQNKKKKSEIMRFSQRKAVYHACCLLECVTIYKDFRGIRLLPSSNL